MRGDRTTPRIYQALMGTIALWALLLAIAAYWRTGKALAALVVVGTVGAFLAMWAIALWRRGREGDQS